MRKPTKIYSLLFLLILSIFTTNCTKCASGSSEVNDKLISEQLNYAAIKSGYQIEIQDGIYAGITFSKQCENVNCFESYLMTTDVTNTKKKEIYLLIKNDSVSQTSKLSVFGKFILDDNKQPYSFSNQMEKFNEPVLTIYITPNTPLPNKTMTLISYEGNLKIYDLKSKSTLFYEGNLEYHAVFEGKFINVSTASMKDTVQIKGEFHF